MTSDLAARNRALGLAINREIWNERRIDKVADYYAEDIVSDYSPYVVRRVLDEMRAAIAGIPGTFEGFREDLKTVIADEERVVLHFTIRGRQTGPWGAIPPSGREVEYDEIVIMTIRDGKVVHQTGVADNLRGLRQVGAIRSP